MHSSFKETKFSKIVTMHNIDFGKFPQIFTQFLKN